MSGAELSQLGWHSLERARSLNLSGQEGLTGYTSGFSALDVTTSGWHPGDLIVVAARPGIGKTTLALHFALAAARSGVATAFVSMEMAPTACWTRAVAAMGPQDERPIRAGYASTSEYERLAATIDRFRHYPTVWKDGTRLTLEQLHSQAQWLQAQELCRLLIIDQLGNLVPPMPRENRVQQVSALAGGVKRIAQDLGIPIIATHQLNRETEHATKERRPEVWHLRDSGVVEQEADIVLLLHRTWQPAPDVLVGPVEVNVAKNRRGLMPLLSLTYNAPQTRFEDAVL